MKTFNDMNLERRAMILGLRTIYRTRSKSAFLTDGKVAEIINDLSTIVEKLADVALDAQSLVEEMGKDGYTPG